MNECILTQALTLAIRPPSRMKYAHGNVCVFVSATTVRNSFSQCLLFSAFLSQLLRRRSRIIKQLFLSTKETLRAMHSYTHTRTHSEIYTFNRNSRALSSFSFSQADFNATDSTESERLVLLLLASRLLSFVLKY